MHFSRILIRLKQLMRFGGDSCSRPWPKDGTSRRIFVQPIAPFIALIFVLAIPLVSPAQISGGLVSGGFAGEPAAFIVQTSAEVAPHRRIDFNVHVRRYSPSLRNDGVSRSPILIAHGVINSDGIVRKLAHSLAQQGFEVWTYNQPGFGQEHRVTETANPAQKGDYGLATLVGTVGAMIKTVKEETGKRPVFIGYSLGGVALELYLQGLVAIESEGRPILSPQKSVHRQKQIERAVFIGTPVLTTENMSMGLNILLQSARCATCLLGWRQGFLNLGLGKEFSLTGRALGLSTALTPNAVLNLVFKEATVWSNLDPDSRNFKNYLATNFSNIHMDLLHDLVKATKHADEIKLNPLRHVPSTHIVGTEDRIADPLKIEAAHQLRVTANPEHKFLAVPGAGHLDVLENGMVRYYVPDLVASLNQGFIQIRSQAQSTRVTSLLLSCEASFSFVGMK